MLRSVAKSVSVFLCVLLIGCVQLSDQSAKGVVVSKPAHPTKQFILLGAGTYEGDLTFALISDGFEVKPIATVKNIVELESDNRIASYKEAGFRYALLLSVRDDFAWQCVFSGAHRVTATLSVIDIATNETMAVVRQTAPNGSCPPLTPVWPLLANELEKVWLGK